MVLVLKGLSRPDSVSPVPLLDPNPPSPRVPGCRARRRWPSRHRHTAGRQQVPRHGDEGRHSTPKRSPTSTRSSTSRFGSAPIIKPICFRTWEQAIRSSSPRTVTVAMPSAQITVTADGGICAITQPLPLPPRALPKHSDGRAGTREPERQVAAALPNLTHKCCRKIHRGETRSPRPWGSNCRCQHGDERPGRAWEARLAGYLGGTGWRVGHQQVEQVLPARGKTKLCLLRAEDGEGVLWASGGLWPVAVGGALDDVVAHLALDGSRGCAQPPGGEQFGQHLLAGGAYASPAPEGENPGCERRCGGRPAGCG